MKLSDPYNVSELRARSITVAVLFGVLFIILLSRLWYLQIWKGAVYREFSDRNRFKVERLSAPRGPLLDRNGQLIADSRPRFEVSFTRGNAQNFDQELNVLRDVFKWNATDFERRVERLKKSPPYQAQTIASDLTFDELALLQSQSLELPSIDIEVNSVRDYLFKDAFFHVVGYTREINEIDLRKYQELYPERTYRQGDQKGVTGIEGLYEPLLRGHDGRDFFVVDVKGRRVNRSQWSMLSEANRIEPESGSLLRLTIDANLQILANDLMKGKDGAVVAMDPRNGEILAYVSHPALDPNAFTGVISSATFDEWMNREDKPYLDRVVGEHYPPGSTLKLVMAAAALESGVADLNTSVFCPGFYRLGNRVWKCHMKEGHGRVNIIQAIERSCDVFFYNVGQNLGLDSMYAWAMRFGFGRRTLIGSELFQGRVDRIFRFNSEQPGHISNSDWVYSSGGTTVEAEAINAAIGQGGYTVTALQLVRMVSAVTNGGKIFQPKLVSSAHDSLGKLLRSFDARLENEVHLKPEVREALLKGMEQVISGPMGTARASRIAGVEFGGKTGTAQSVALELSKRLKRKEFEDHALFVGAAPLHDPRIAVAVIVENGGHGSGVAPIAKALIQSHLKQFAEGDKAHAN